MADISQPMQIATSTPKEAAENIDNADLFGVDPDEAKNLKSQLQPEVEAAKKPAEATPRVARYIAQSGEHAALAQPDVNKLSWMEKRLKYLGDQVFKIPSDDRKINDLAFKKMFEKDKFTENDELELFQLNENAANRTDYGLGDFTDPNTPRVDKAIKSLGFLGQVGRGMVDSILENKEIVAGGAATGAGIGAIAGAPAGGVGAIPGAIAGAGTGLVYGGLTAMAYDGAVQQMGSTYNMLSNLKTTSFWSGYDLATASMVGGSSEVPLNIDEDTKKYISIGVGSAVGAISLIGGRAIAKTVPFLADILTKKGMQQVLTSAENQAFKMALMNIGKAGAVGFVEGASQEYVRIIGEEVGKTYDGSKASFINGLINASTKLETLKRSTVSGVLQAPVSMGFSAIGNAVGFKKRAAKIKAAEDSRIRGARDVTPQPVDPQFQIRDGGFTVEPATSDIAPIKPKGSGNGPKTPIDTSIDVLHFEEAVKDVTKISGETEMKKIAPGQLFKLRQSMAQESGVDRVFLDKEDLQNFASNEEKGAAVRNIIDSDGEAAASTNAPIQVDTHKFLELVDKYPDAANLAKLTPEGPTADQARKYLESIDQAATKRQEILTKLGAKDITPEDKATLQQALETEQPFRTYPSNEVFGEDEYLKQPTLIEAIDKVFAEGEGKKYKDAQLKARQSVAQGIAETAQLEMNQVVDIVAEEARTAEYDAQMDRLQNNPNLALVDRFKVGTMKPDNRFDSVATATASHAKPGYSPVAIDPRLMTDEQKALFAKNKQLRTHKVFVKGGMSPDDSARLLGVNNGDNLLRILSQTPSREDVAAYRTAQREADILENAKQSVDLNKTAIANAYNDNTANHIAEMKFMKDKQWGDVKTGIKKIALPLPTKEGLRIRAESAVKATTVSKLNVNQFKVGERKSQRMAVDAILKNQVEKAFVNKEAAALNSELARATHIAIGEVNRVIRFARKLNSPENKAELKNAGFDKAANEILNVFNLTSKKTNVESGAFEKYIRQSLEQGDAVTTIPERLSDVRQSLGEMTVEQVTVVGDALKNMLHQAKMKNKLYTKFENQRILQTVEGIGSALEKQAQKNREYDVNKISLDQNTDKTSGEVAVKGVLETGAYLRRTQNILVTLDNGKDVGLFNDLFWQTIKNANDKENQTAIKFDKQIQDKIIKRFGEKEFQELQTAKVIIPEFKGTKIKGNGQMSKMDLLMMNMNRGNSGNIKALERYGVSHEIIKTVIERELNDHKYMELTQRIWDLYKSLEPMIIDLEKRTKGIDVKMVQGEPIEYTANGETRTYPGGYFPISTIVDEIKSKAEQLVGSTEVNKADKFRQKFYAQAQTEQGHLEMRTGSDALLDLSPANIGKGLAQSIHDIHMREVLRDNAKLLSDKKIRETIVKVVGKDGYNNIANNVIAQANSVENKVGGEAGLALLNAVDYVMGNFTSAHILIKASSILVQTASLPIAVNRIPKGAKHIIRAMHAVNTNFTKSYEFAEKYHSPLKAARENLENEIVHKLNEFLPSKKWKHGDPVRAALEMTGELGYNALQQADNYTKVVIFHTAYFSAMNGDVDYIKIGDHNDAVKYASNVTELTTTHSSERNLAPIQRVKWLKSSMRFYNDISIAGNNIVDKAKQIKGSFQEAHDSYKKKDYSRAYKAGKAGAGMFAATMLALTMSKMISAAMRGEQILPFDDDDDAETAIKKSLIFMGTAPVDVLAGMVPYLRDAVYPITRELVTGKPQKIEPPIAKVVNTFKDSVIGVSRLLDFSENAVDITDQQKKSFIYSAGYLIRNLPSDAIYNYLLKPDWSELPVTVKSELDVLNDRIEKFKKSLGVNLGDNANAEEIPPELMKQLEQTNIDTGEEVPPEMLQQLEQLQMQINPVTPNTRVTPETMDIIKKIESNGEWDAQNPNSSAAGLYQFTESTWRDLMDRAPELGLTENGRVSADTSQQEIAMEYFTNENIDRLERNGLEASIENVYAAHFLGGAGAVDVLSSDDKTKLQDLVGKTIMRANGFRPTMKVKDFKRWLTRKTTRAIEAIQNQASIDNPTN